MSCFSRLMISTKKALNIIAKPQVCFTFFLGLYVFLGMLMSYCGLPESCNIVFDSDSPYVARELYDPLFSVGDFTSWHSSRHPLLVLLLQPIVHVINGITNDYMLAMILFIAFCGAATTTLLSMSLKELRVSSGIQILFVLIYGFSFSSLVFLALIETFAVNALCVMSTWYAVLKMTRKKKALDWKDAMILLLIGVFDMGITLTNYIQYIAAVIFLYCIRPKTSHWVRDCLFALLAPIALVLFLVEIEVFVWNQYVRFYVPIIKHFILGADWETMHFADSSFGLAKIAMWAKELLLSPILSPDIIAVPDKDGAVIFATFGGYGVLQAGCLLGFWAIGCLLVCSKMLNVFKTRRVKTRRVKTRRVKTRRVKTRRVKTRRGCFFVFVLCIVVLNLAFHFYFNPKEGFIYTQNYLCLLMMLFAFALSSLKARMVKRALAAFFVAMLVFMIASNLSALSDVVEIVWQNVGCEVAPAHALIMAVLVCTFAGICWSLISRFGVQLSANKDHLAVLACTAYAVIIALYCIFLVFALTK